MRQGKPSDYLKAKASVAETEEKEGIIDLTLKDFASIVFAGSSVDSNIADCQLEYQSLTLKIKKGQSGLVALAVVYKNGGKRTTAYPFFLKMSYAGEQPQIDLENIWNSPKARLGQITGDGITVRVNETIYATVGAINENIPHQVVSGNLLCAYLQGDIEEDKLKESVEKQVQQEEKQKELEAQVDLMKEALRIFDSGAFTVRNSLGGVINQLKHALKNIEKNFWVRLFTPKSIVQLLQKMLNALEENEGILRKLNWGHK